MKVNLDRKIHRQDPNYPADFVRYVLKVHRDQLHHLHLEPMTTMHSSNVACFHRFYEMMRLMIIACDVFVVKLLHFRLFPSSFIMFALRNISNQCQYEGHLYVELDFATIELNSIEIKRLI